jgi:adenine-specific DNA-methyltransferase
LKKITAGAPESRSADVAFSNLEALRKLFPDAFVEGKLDLEALGQLVGHCVAPGEEKYGLGWHGKKNVRQLALAPSTGTLRPCPEQSLDWERTQNLMIEGDNLEVLKLLQKSYAGKVTLIYIDPPYNTGNDFVYPDDYHDNIKNYLSVTGQVDVAGRKLSTNTEASGRFHTDWLNLMYPRLKLARSLLAPDGFIVISIDDVELGNLRIVCDEIFGGENFIGPVVRNTNSSKNQSQFLSVSHDYALFYARDIEALGAKAQACGPWEVRKNNLDAFLKQLDQLRAAGLSPEEMTEELKELVKRPRFIDFVNYWNFDDHPERGVYRKGDLGGVKNGNMTPLMNPLTGKPDPVPPGGFRFDSKKLAELIADGRVHFHTDGSLPTIKRYLKENLTSRPKSIMSDDQRPDHGLLKRYSVPFDNPKQLAFMERIVGIADKDALVLDFFAGSGTTGHAVMQLNAQDGGKRRFILVQLPEPTEAKDFEHLAQMTERRLAKASEEIRNAAPLNRSIDLGFRVFKLDSSNIRAWEPVREALGQTLLENLEHIKSGRAEQDLLYELLLKLGLDLCVPIEKKPIAGKTVHSIGAGVLFACLGDKVAVKDAEPLALGIAEWRDALAPAGESTCVFRDSAFANDVAKTNLTAVLEQHGIAKVRSI